MPARPLAALALALLVPSAALAGPLAPTKVSDLVTVYTKPPFVPCPTNGTAFTTRVLPDGSEEPFVIPPKKAFVITRVSYIFQSNAIPNVYAAPFVSLQSGASIAPVVQGDGVTDASGNASGTLTIPHGVAVRGPGTLCITSGESATGFLHGFFAKDK